MTSWLENFIVAAASASGASVGERLKASPLTEWELERWTRGLGRELVRLNGSSFRLGSGRQSSFSLFVKDESGAPAGLRREALTQAAAYVALIMDYGYPRSLVGFEVEGLDVAVRDPRGGVLIYAETKASAASLERLLARLAADFEGGLPLLDEEEQDDAYKKADRVLDHRPAYFWAVAPGERKAFRVRFTQFGFGLDPLADLPRKDHLRMSSGRL